MRIKKLAAFLAAAVMATSAMVSTAGASYLHTVKYDIKDCRSNETLRKVDKKYQKFREYYYEIAGRTVYCGDLYVAMDYDIIGDDDVQAKVVSSAWKHYAIAITDKESKASDDKSRGYAAYSGWATLPFSNDKDDARFWAGFFID